MGYRKGRKLCREPECIANEGDSFSARAMDTYKTVTQWACEDSLSERA